MNDALHTTVISKIMQKFDKNSLSRTEALRDVLLLQDQSVENASHLAETIPELPLALQCKWATLFADRLFATVSREQIEDLCLPDKQNEAALTMVFVLFLESERMEKQMEADITVWREQGVISQDILPHSSHE